MHGSNTKQCVAETQKHNVRHYAHPPTPAAQLVPPVPPAGSVDQALWYGQQRMCASSCRPVQQQQQQQQDRGGNRRGRSRKGQGCELKPALRLHTAGRPARHEAQSQCALLQPMCAKYMHVSIWMSAVIKPHITSPVELALCLGFVVALPLTSTWNWYIKCHHHP
jgi:hypothetical protein